MIETLQVMVLLRAKGIRAGTGGRDLSQSSRDAEWFVPAGVCPAACMGH